MVVDVRELRLVHPRLVFEVGVVEEVGSDLEYSHEVGRTKRGEDSAVDLAVALPRQEPDFGIEVRGHLRVPKVQPGPL